LKNQLHKKGGAKSTKEPKALLCHARRVLRKYCSRFLEEYFCNDKDFHRRKKRIRIQTTKSLLPKAWNRTFVQKAPLVGFEKKETIKHRGIF
jgi:hypothetical protein